tara:strand:- start:1176 stop:2282 length:1107 start_codon:yes stop_codon:yes gene_type:complete
MEVVQHDYLWFRAPLLNWYKNNYRDFPWRSTKNPYYIWLSEIILQQTRIDQGLKYYQKFIRHYPTVQDLAEASEEAVLKDWQGLGYYSRARNLHFAALQIIKIHEGNFPNTYNGIKELKGVGDYTAAAIASFAFDLPHAVVDGNVYRFLSRLFGIKLAIDSTEGIKFFKSLAQDLLSEKNPALHNQAMMEIGATVCTPKKTKCESCPFKEKCVAHQKQTIDQFPVKKKKLTKSVRYFHYLIVDNREFLWLHKRVQKGIWQNLYDFPLLEATEIERTKKELKQALASMFRPKFNFDLQYISEQKKHILSHQIIKARFYHLKTDNALIKSDFFIKCRKEDIKKYPIPRLIEKYLNEETNLLSLTTKSATN